MNFCKLALLVVALNLVPALAGGVARAEGGTPILHERAIPGTDAVDGNAPLAEALTLIQQALDILEAWVKAHPAPIEDAQGNRFGAAELALQALEIAKKALDGAPEDEDSHILSTTRVRLEVALKALGAAAKETSAAEAGRQSDPGPDPDLALALGLIVKAGQDVLEAVTDLTRAILDEADAAVEKALAQTGGAIQDLEEWLKSEGSSGHSHRSEAEQLVHKAHGEMGEARRLAEKARQLNDKAQKLLEEAHLHEEEAERHEQEAQRLMAQSHHRVGRAHQLLAKAHDGLELARTLLEKADGDEEAGKDGDADADDLLDEPVDLTEEALLELHHAWTLLAPPSLGKP